MMQDWRRRKSNAVLISPSFSYTSISHSLIFFISLHFLLPLAFLFPLIFHLFSSLLPGSSSGFLLFHFFSPTSLISSFSLPLSFFSCLYSYCCSIFFCTSHLYNHRLSFVPFLPHIDVLIYFDSLPFSFTSPFSPNSSSSIPHSFFLIIVPIRASVGSRAKCDRLRGVN